MTTRARTTAGRARRRLPRARTAVAVLVALACLAAGGPAAAAPNPPPTPNPSPTPSPSSPKPSPSGTGDKPAKAKDECDDDGGHALLPFSKPPSIRCMTRQAVKTIFDVSDDGWVAKPTIRWVIGLPDFVKGHDSQVAGAERLTRDIAFALLLGIVTFTLLHYWAAGLLSGAGGAALMDGVSRCVGAGLLILAWPFIYQNVVNVTNVVSSLVIPPKWVDGSIAAYIGIGALIGGAGRGWVGALFVGIAIIVAFVLLFLTLLLMKIGLLAGLVVAFVGMPIAIALWPLPATSAPAGYGVRFTGMVCTVVILWALCFMVFGGVNAQFAWGNGDAGNQQILLPLVGIAELAALLSVPRHAVTMWNVAASNRGVLASAGGFTASNFMTNAIGRHMSDRSGSQRNSLAQRSSSSATQSRTGGGASGSSSRRGAGRATPRPASAGAGRGTGSAGASRGAAGASRGAAGASTGAAGRARSDGLPRARTSAAPIREQVRNAQLAAMNRRQSRPPDVAAVQAAIRQVGSEAGGRYSDPLRRVAGGAGGGRVGSVDDRRIVRRLSEASVATSVSNPTRLAFQTIGAATPEVRRSAFGGVQPSTGPSASSATPPPRPTPIS